MIVFTTRTAATRVSFLLFIYLSIYHRWWKRCTPLMRMASFCVSRAWIVSESDEITHSPYTMWPVLNSCCLSMDCARTWRNNVLTMHDVWRSLLLKPRISRESTQLHANSGHARADDYLDECQGRLPEDNIVLAVYHVSHGRYRYFNDTAAQVLIPGRHATT